MKKLIDFHTHIFPDPIANRAAANVGEYYSLRMEGDGTAKTLRAHAPAGVDCRFVISSAAMKAKNVVAGNDFLLSKAGEDSAYIPFGSFHPEMGEAESIAEIERIAEAGVKGIKIHPDFQHLFIDAPEMLTLYRRCAELGLPILFHVGDKNTDYSTPKRMRRVCDSVPELKVVAAHLGGYSVWEQATEFLGDTGIYVDCSEARPYLSEEETEALIRSFGVDRVLFGSDYPVFRTDTAYDHINALSFSEEEKERIFYRNAEELLGL
ncbi:MAG: amidohydrolase family protein [Clostridia bacterium]|nr:amidohydrolase family protein [Clostridia bacterium]